MHLILFNISWMSFNIFLAIIPVFFGLLLVHTKSFTLRLIYGIIWFIFLPNTIYLLTDIGHFFKDWPLIPLAYKAVFMFEYVILMATGVFTFIFGFYPVERFIRYAKRKKTKQKEEYIIYALNFLIGFGIVLGRVERINSWDIIVNMSTVVYHVIYTFHSLYLVLLALFFGICSNLIYFSFRDIILKRWNKLFS